MAESKGHKVPDGRWALVGFTPFGADDNIDETNENTRLLYDIGREIDLPTKCFSVAGNQAEEARAWISKIATELFEDKGPEFTSPVQVVEPY